MARVPNLTRSDPLRPTCDHPPRPRERHGRRRQRSCFARHSAPLALQTSGGRTRSRPFRRHGRVPSSVLRDARPPTSGRCPQRASLLLLPASAHIDRDVWPHAPCIETQRFLAIVSWLALIPLWARPSSPPTRSPTTLSLVHSSLLPSSLHSGQVQQNELSSLLCSARVRYLATALLL